MQRFLVGWGCANLSTCPLQESKSLSIGGAFHTFGVLVPQHFKRRKKENKEGEKEKENLFNFLFIFCPVKERLIYTEYISVVNLSMKYNFDIHPSPTSPVLPAREIDSQKTSS